VVADPDRIHQVLINLLSNAAKFTARGRVLVSAAAESGSVVLQVADTGSGIPEQDLSHVFDKYRQAARQQDTLRVPQQGTGLGLAICKEIVEHYRGSITAASTYGHGATFTVRLPVA
jgi:signal transduction histidine kinase